MKANDYVTRRSLIAYKMVGREKEKLEKFVEKLEGFLTSLRGNGYIDAKILYSVQSESGHGYIGEDSAQFLDKFTNQEKISQVDIQISALFDEHQKVFQRQVQLHLEVARNLESNKANFLWVAGTDESWVNGTFASIIESLEVFNAKNKWLYWPISEMVVQLWAVVTIVAVSVYVSSKYGSMMSLAYSHVYLFIALFLLGSNMWTYVVRVLIYLRGRYFPVVGFKLRTVRYYLLALLVALFSIICEQGVTRALDIAFK